MSEVDQKIINKAYDLLENGELHELYDLIKPYIGSGDPHIEYIYSSFSLPEFNETNEEFDKRIMKGLHMAVQANIPNAVYALAVDYMLGDEVEKDENKAANLFKKGMELGHGICTLTHGLNLFYGHLGVKIDKQVGLELIKKAYDMNVEYSEYEYTKAKENVI